MTKDKQIEQLKRLLWLNHGHNTSFLYGDDGEMQCSQCLYEYGFYDWKRTPVEEIVEKIEAANLLKAANQVTPADPVGG